MPNKQFVLYFQNFEKGLIVLYVRDLPVVRKLGLFARHVERGRVLLSPVDSLRHDPPVLHLVVHFRLGQENAIKAGLGKLLLDRGVNDSPFAEIFEVGQ